MGFISSRFPTVVHGVVTLFLVCELWTQCIVVNGALEESDSHEHTPFYDSHNHISEHDHFHEDGYCDCNSQGPWRPLFKPSQAELPDPESLHHLAESLHNSHDQLHDQLHDLPNVLHPNLHSGDRQAKKQNHLIHLHLIPHIYVPVVHPMSYPVYENNDHKPVTEQNHEYQTTESSASAENHYGEHSQEHDHQFYQQDNHLNLPNQNYPNTNHHDFSEHSHESSELNNGHNGYYYPQQSAEEHQYQVHEEANRDPFYGNFATGSSDNAHVLPVHKHVNFNMFHKKFADRSRYNKRFLDFPHNMLRMRVMRPPALGQKNTWLMNYADNNPFPSKTVFDFKPYPVKAPLFDFKHFMKPNIVQPLQPVIPAGKFMQTPMVSMNKFLQPQVMPINKLLPAPVVVYPTDIKKRMDKGNTKN